MDSSQLLRPEPPFQHFLVASPSEACNQMWALEQNSQRRIIARMVRGDKMTTWPALFDELAAALQFPDYFGENLDALDECLADLEWLPADAHVLFIANCTHLLEKEPKPVEAFKVFWELLQRASQTWSKAKRQDLQSAKPFHVIWQCTIQEEPAFRLKVKEIHGSLSVVS